MIFSKSSVMIPIDRLVIRRTAFARDHVETAEQTARDLRDRIMSDCAR